MQIQLTWKSFRNVASVILVLLASTVISQAQQPSNQKTFAVKIKNFGQMDERFYRGARPKQEDLKDLAAMGIKTVIDLTEDPASRSAWAPNTWRTHRDSTASFNTVEVP